MFRRSQFIQVAGVAASTLLNVAPVHADMRQTCGNLDLDLSYIGSGGSGTVFRGIQSTQKQRDSVVVKVSRPVSEASVRKEAALLQELNKNGVENIERYITSCSMKIREGVEGYATVLEPYLNPPEAPSIASIEDDSLGLMKIKTSRSLMKTCVQFIASNVYLTDLQLLVEPGTGRMLIIDLTEGDRLHLGETTELSFKDRTAISSFLGECLSFVEEAASKAPEEIAKSIRRAAIEGIEEGVKSSRHKERLTPAVIETIHIITERLA